MTKKTLLMTALVCVVGFTPFLFPKPAEALGGSWADLISEINAQLPVGDMRSQLVAAAEAIQFYEAYGTDEQLDEAEEDYMDLHVSFEGPGEMTHAQGDPISDAFDAALFASRLSGTSKKKWPTKCNAEFECKPLGWTCWYKTNFYGRRSCHDWP